MHDLLTETANMKKFIRMAAGLLFLCGLLCLICRYKTDTFKVVPNEIAVGAAGNVDKQITTLEDVDGIDNGPTRDTGMAYSPDGKRSAVVEHYEYSADPYDVSVFDGNIGTSGKRYADVRDPVFSPDGKWVAYPATDTSYTPDYPSFQHWFMVVNSKESKHHLGVFHSG